MAKAALKTPAAIDFFSQAPVAASPKKKGKKDKEILTIPGFKNLAMIREAKAQLEVTESDILEEIKNQVKDYAIEKGREHKKRPENPSAIDENAYGTVQVKKRSSLSPLSEIEIEILRDNGIEMEEVRSAPDSFMINPKYAADMEMLQKISQALNTIEGVPADLIQKIPSTVKTVVGSNALDQIFQKPEVTCRALFPLVTVIAVGPKIEAGIREVFDHVANLMGLRNNQKKQEAHIQLMDQLKNSVK